MPRPRPALGTVQRPRLAADEGPRAFRRVATPYAPKESRDLFPFRVFDRLADDSLFAESGEWMGGNKPIRKRFAGNRIAPAIRDQLGGPIPSRAHGRDESVEVIRRFPLALEPIDEPAQVTG